MKTSVQHFIEVLESRIAPATLINPTTVTYQDVDGDTVTVKISKAVFPDEATANSVFTFDTGTVNGNNGTAQQLQLLNLNALIGGEAKGATVTFTAKPGENGGDGFVNIGHIQANVDLAMVTVQGDLGQIDVGDNDPETPALKSLKVQSMGRFGTSTQGGGDLRSLIFGSLSSLIVASDILDATINVLGSGTVKLGSVTIGGSLLGGTTDFGGRLESAGSIGMVKIAGDVNAGTGMAAGVISAQGGAIAGVTIGGSLIASPMSDSGKIVGGPIGPVKIHGDMVGGGMDSGRIESLFPITSVTIGGSLVGGSGKDSGEIISAGINGSLGMVKIGGDVLGKGENSARIFGPTIDGVSIGGSLEGGSGPQSGSIFSAGELGKVTIGGSVIGGAAAAANFSGRIAANKDIGAVKIGGDLVGGGGEESGAVRALGSGLKSVQIGGSVIGGTGLTSGVVSAADLGSVVIGRDLVGRLGNTSGVITGFQSITSVKVGGSVKGPIDASDDFTQSGEIFSDGTIGSIVINGDLVGGSANAVALDGAGDIQARRIGSLFIGGSIIAGVEAGGGTLAGSGAVRVHDDLGAVTVKGSLIGNDTHRVQIIAHGQAMPTATKNVAIKSLTVGGRVELADVLAGYEFNAVASNDDAQIGAIKVGGDWIASNVATGIDPVDGFYGNGNDIKSGSGTDTDVISRIASIEIKGQALGTLSSINPNDHFGFVSQEIGSFKVGGTAFPLVAGEASTADIAGYAVGATGDLRVREVALL